METITTCIFDLDGVLVDTAKYHYLAWKRLANQLGFDFTQDHNERLKGVSRMRSLEILLEVGKVTLSEAEKIKYAEIKNKWYVDFVTKMKPDEIFPGVINFLSELKQHHIKIVLGSASKNALTILDQLQITHFFDAIIDGNSVTHAKPNPEVFLQGAKAVKANPENCVVFEDAVAGIEAALNANMKCIGVGDKKTLNKAHMVISGFEKTKYKKLIDKLKNELFETNISNLTH